MKGLTLALVGAMLSSPTLAAVAQNDAGTGADAPDSRQDAVDVPAGAFRGELVPDDDDLWDWYRIAVTEGLVARVHMQPPPGINFDLQLYDDDGDFLDGSLFLGDALETVAGISDGAIRVGILARNDRGAYAVEMEVFEPPDLAVTNLVVVAFDTATDVTDLPLNTQGRVEVTMTNVGRGSAPSAIVFAWVEHSTSGAERYLGSDELEEILPGEERRIDFDWDGMGEVGEAEVNAQVWHRWDTNLENDHAVARGYMIAENTGLGVDAFNNRVAVGQYPAGSVVAGTYYSQGELGPYGVVHGPSNTYGGAYALADPSSKTARILVHAWGPLGIVSAELRAGASEGSPYVCVRPALVVSCVGQE